MSSFPWESSTQAANRLAVSRRIETGPLAGRYEYAAGRARDAEMRQREPHLRRDPRPPKKLSWAADGGHPKGKREWEQYKRAHGADAAAAGQVQRAPDPIMANRCPVRSHGCCPPGAHGCADAG